MFLKKKKRGRKRESTVCVFYGKKKEKKKSCLSKEGKKIAQDKENDDIQKEIIKTKEL